MAYLTVEISCSKSIAGLNERANAPGNKQDVINAIINQLAAMACGADNGSVKVVIKDAASTINTSGSGSTTATYTV